MKYFKVSSAEFATVEGEYDIVCVKDNYIYVGSNKELTSPFVVSGLPEGVAESIAEELEEAKANKKKEIDAAKIAYIEGGVTFKDKVFQSAEYDRNLLTSTVSLYSITGTALPDGFVWISEDNTSVPMTLQELIQLGALMAQKVNEGTIKARQLKDQTLSAQTINEVAAIKFE
jgi:hypothetical protein